MRAATSTIQNNGARAAITQTMGTMGVPMVGAGAGLLYLNGCLLAYYSTKGTRLGILSSYCAGYVVKVFEEKTKQSGHLTSAYFKRAAAQNAAAQHYVAGYKDAESGWGGRSNRFSFLNSAS